jgi:hypothetical protein
MEVSGQLHAPAILPPGKEPSEDKFNWNFVLNLFSVTSTMDAQCYQFFVARQLILISMAQSFIHLRY